MSSKGDLQNFVKRLDDLLQKYSDLLNMNFDREYCRSMKLQEMKYKEKISALESKLRITKMKLRWETNLRMKSEKKREEIEKKLEEKSLDIHEKMSVFSLSSSNDNFVTAANSFIFTEHDLNESNLLFSNFRKHQTNYLRSNIPKIHTDINTRDVFKIPNKHSLHVNTKIKSPDISYPGFKKLEEKYSSELETREPSPLKYRRLDSDIEYSDSARTPISNGIEKSIKSPCETLKITPVKNSCSIHFSPHRESTPLSQKSSCFDTTLSPCNLQKPNNERSISRLAPLIPPMIPPAVIHCINEIEKRGLKEIGLYRMAGDDDDIMNLHERFGNFETDIDFAEINIHSIASFLKSFLCNFPLIPEMFHDKFAQVIVENDSDWLYYVISDLPQANRDTLAYLIIHLRRVSFSIQCKMSSSRLAAVFGPIVFGLHTFDKENQLSDVPISVMEKLLKLPSSYWNSFIVDPTNSETPNKLRNSPSTEEIVSKKANKFFSSHVRKKKYFTSP